MRGQTESSKQSQSKVATQSPDNMALTPGGVSSNKGNKPPDVGWMYTLVNVKKMPQMLCLISCSVVFNAGVVSGESSSLYYKNQNEPVNWPNQRPTNNREITRGPETFPDAEQDNQVSPVDNSAIGSPGRSMTISNSEAEFTQEKPVSKRQPEISINADMKVKHERQQFDKVNDDAIPEHEISTSSSDHEEHQSPTGFRDDTLLGNTEGKKTLKYDSQNTLPKQSSWRSQEGHNVVKEHPNSDREEENSTLVTETDDKAGVENNDDEPYSDETEDDEDVTPTREWIKGESDRLRNLTYTDPINYYMCGRCKCHNTTSRSSYIDVHAECQHRYYRKTDIPEHLPRQTIYLNLARNYLELTDFNNFSCYPFLYTLDLSRNSIERLDSTSCDRELRLESLDLFGNRISEITDGSFSCMPHLKSLGLAENRLTTISSLMLKGLSNLVELSFEFNNIYRIEEDAFDNCPSLESLKLRKNKQMTYAKLTPRLFRPLKKLKGLYIQGFKGNRSPYPQAALAELTHLEYLTVDGIRHAQFNSSMESLKNLRFFSIGYGGYCHLHNVSDSLLKHLSMLTTFEMIYCQLTHISSEIYTYTPRLEELTFYYVNYTFDEFFDHLYTLRNSNLKELTGSAIGSGAYKNPCRCLTAKHVENIHYMTKLETLNLVRNHITFIEPGFVYGLPSSLRVLNIRVNLLAQYTSIFTLCGGLPNLEVLLEERQNRESYYVNELYDKEMRGTTQYTVSNYDFVKDKLYPQSKSKFCSNGTCFQGEKQSNFLFPVNIIEYSGAESFRFGEILLIDEKQQNYSTRIFNISNSFDGGLRYKNMSKWVEIADISNNSCDSLSTDFFHVDNRLRHLHMRNNFVGHELSQDFHGAVFSSLQYLQYIDLSNNLLHNLPSNVFKGLKQIEVINLSNNGISSFNITLSHMHSLKFIDLSNNGLGWITKGTRDDLDSLVVRGQKVSLDLTNNPLPCSCEGLEFIRWLATSNVLILNKDFLRCEDENKMSNYIGNFDLKLKSLQRQCMSNGMIVLAVSLSAAMLFMILSAVTLFRNRWRLYYFKNVAITRMYGFKGKDESSSTYNFDAYLLYNQADEDFVLKECLKELEEKRGHRLCIEDRDFLTGSFIPCNITSAVRSSRVTIPVISPDFWEGKWSEYGLQMAVMESIHAKRNVLHLLLYKHVPVEEMSRDLIKVHKDHEFSEYPPKNCSDDVREAFWDALSQTIGHTSSSDRRLTL